MFKQAIASVLFCFTALGAYAEVVNVDNAELARLAASGVPVIDVRTEGEWKQSGVISGSKLLTYFDERGRAEGAASGRACWVLEGMVGGKARAQL